MSNAPKSYPSTAVQAVIQAINTMSTSSHYSYSDSNTYSDNLDSFANYLLTSKPRIRFAVIQQFATEVKHPVYHHLLKTLDSENAPYVIGYLRSQKMVEVHSFVDKIMSEQ